MPAATNTVVPVTQGDDLDLTRTIPGLPSGQSLTTAWLMVKTRASDADAAALISKTITTTNVAGVGQITDAGASGTAQLLFNLTAADTRALPPATPLALSVKVKLANGKEGTTELGTLTAAQAVVQAS